MNKLVLFLFLKNFFLFVFFFGQHHYEMKYYKQRLGFFGLSPQFSNIKQLLPFSAFSSWSSAKGNQTSAEASGARRIVGGPDRTKRCIWHCTSCNELVTACQIVQHSAPAMPKLANRYIWHGKSFKLVHLALVQNGIEMGHSGGWGRLMNYNGYLMWGIPYVP